MSHRDSEREGWREGVFFSPWFKEKVVQREALNINQTFLLDRVMHVISLIKHYLSGSCETNTFIHHRVLYYFKVSIGI